MNPAEPVTYRMHGGARGAYIVVGVLLCVLVITIPFAIWVFVSVGRGRIELWPDRLVVRAFRTTTWPLDSIRRLGVLRVRVPARGIGGAIARKKVGGKEAVHLCALDDRGRNYRVMASSFENYQDLISRVADRGLPIEDVKMGAVHPKWA